MDRLVSNHGLSHLALHILSYVEIVPDINNCRLVCKEWKALIDSSILMAKRRLNYLTPLRFIVLDKWKDFNEAYVNIMNCKDLKQVKKFIWCFEKYLQDTGPQYQLYSPIHWFAKHGVVKIVMFFVSLVSSLNEKSGPQREDMSTFSLACNNGHVGLVKALIEASKTIDIDLNAGCFSGLTGLMYASRHGHYDVVKTIFEKSEEVNIDLNARCNQWENAFTWALTSDSQETLDLFLRNKSIQLNIIDEHGYSSFWSACRHCIKSTNVIRHLVENSEELGINLNHMDEYEDGDMDTGFLIACRQGNFEAVKIIGNVQLQFFSSN